MEGLKNEWHWQDLATRYKARLDVLEEELANLKEQQRFSVKEIDLTMAIFFGLSASESVVLGLLLTRPHVTKATFMQAIYSSTGREEVFPKIIDVWICRLRKVLRPYGLEIKTVWGKGYYMLPETKEKIRALTRPLDGIDESEQP